MLVNKLIDVVDRLTDIGIRQQKQIIDLQELSKMHLTRIEALEAEVQRLKEGR